MCWTCVGRVLDMCCTCVGRVLDVCFGCSSPLILSCLRESHLSGCSSDSCGRPRLQLEWNMSNLQTPRTPEPGLYHPERGEETRGSNCGQDTFNQVTVRKHVEGTRERWIDSRGLIMNLWRDVQVLMCCCDVIVGFTWKSCLRENRERLSSGPWELYSFSETHKNRKQEVTSSPLTPDRSSWALSFSVERSRETCCCCEFTQSQINTTDRTISALLNLMMNKTVQRSSWVYSLSCRWR